MLITMVSLIKTINAHNKQVLKKITVALGQIQIVTVYLTKMTNVQKKLAQLLTKVVLK